MVGGSLPIGRTRRRCGISRQGAGCGDDPAVAATAGTAREFHTLTFHNTDPERRRRRIDATPARWSRLRNLNR
jgi:hypothetical protein